MQYFFGLHKCAEKIAGTVFNYKKCYNKFFDECLWYCYTLSREEI